MAEFITESVAANFYAVAWNKLDAMVLKELLDNDVEYIIKKSGNSIQGKNDLLKYLQKTMNKIKKAPIEYEIYAETGETINDRVCVLLAQGNIDKIINAVFFTLTKGKITKVIVDKYDPEVVIWRSGNYPGTDDTINDNEYVENRPRLVEEYDVEPIVKKDEEPDVDFEDIKDRFLEKHPKLKRKKPKNILVAVLLAFFFPSFGLFYLSIKQGIAGFFVSLAASWVYSAIITARALKSATIIMNGNMPTVPHSNFFSIMIGISLFGLILRLVFALWAYFVARYNNESLI